MCLWKSSCLFTSDFVASYFIFVFLFFFLFIVVVVVVFFYCIYCNAFLRSVHTRRHLAATRRGGKPLLVYRSGDKLLQQLTVHFVAATSRRKSNQFEFVRLVAATKLCCSDKDFHKNSPVHTKRFVAATCRRDALQRLVA